MKKSFLFVAVLFVLPHVSFAAATTENFDSYTNGTSLNGANSSSGWTSPWTINGGVWTSDTAPAGGQGGLALHTSTTFYDSIARTFGPISSGILHYQFSFSDATSGQ